ncbi:hypothetical protein AAG570_012356, partial [Ranatra chinensis]
VLRALDKQISQDVAYKQSQLRQKAIEEIFTSEESYLKQLELALKFFKRPLQDSKFILPNILKSVFDNLESVYNVNGELLNQLRQNGDDVATSFRTVAPFFKLYSVYAYDYRHGLNSLQELHKTNSKLDNFIKRQESRPEVGKKLSSLLIAPIQRIPRYRLLLKEVLSHTPQVHEHHSAILEALKEVEVATEHINSLVHEQENMLRLIELQKSLQGGKPTIVCPGRKLLKEGMLMKVSKSGRKAHMRYFVLLSDVLMYCKTINIVLAETNSLRCCCVLPLRKCSVQHVLGEKVFNITCHTLSLKLFSEEPRVSTDWVAAISQAIKQEQEDRSTLRRKSSARQPLWNKDLNSMTETLTPRKRKQNQNDIEDVSVQLHSPWKRNKVTSTSSSIKVLYQNPCTVNNEIILKRSGYFSSLKKAILNIGQSLQKYWFPIYTGRENLERSLMD